MAAKGSILKQEITNKIVEIFPNSFLYNNNKEIRINGVEEGSPLQIKITLTCVKTPVENEDFPSIPSQSNAIEFKTSSELPTPATINEPTEEEKETLKTLLEGLNFE